MTRIAVTGIQGFVGRNLVPALLKAGHELRGLVRPGSDDPDFVDGEAVQGDVRSLERVRSLVQGCEIVVHLASSFAPDDDIPRIVVEGARNVVTASREVRSARLVMVSCLGADAAASDPFYAARWQAEMTVRGAEGDLPYVILRPSLILGREDGVTSSLAGLVRKFPFIPIPGPGQARSQPVDVSDFTRCLEIASTSVDFLNQTISVGGPAFITFRQLVDLVAGHSGVVKSKMILPDAVIQAVSRSLPPGSRDLYSPARLAQFRQGVVASPGIIQRVFGFEAVSVIPRLPDYLP